MKKLIVISVAVGLVLSANCLTPSYAQAPTKDDTPTFYRLVPGTYVNGWPRFAVTYPKEWVEAHPLMNEVFRAGIVFGEQWSLNVFTDPRPLEQAAEPYVGFFKAIANDVSLVSDRPSQLRDGTPAREFRVQFTSNGTPISIVALATKRGDLLVQLSMGWPGRDARDDLKAILYSLTFQPGFDEPVKVPPDIQAFLDKFFDGVVSHDLEKVMSHYSDRFLDSGVRKGEVEQQLRQYIGSITSQKSVVTDFIAAGDRAFLAGFSDMTPFGRAPLRGTAIIKENGEWKWYGNQRDAVAW